MTSAANHASSLAVSMQTLAAFCTILAIVGVPTFRAWRHAKRERAQQTAMLTAMHGAIFGKARVVENGVTVETETVGIRDRMQAVEKSLNNGLRADMRNAADAAKQASVLAANAAATASVAQQQTTDGLRDVGQAQDRTAQAVQGLADRVEGLASAVAETASEQRRLWGALRPLGIDRREQPPDD